LGEQAAGAQTAVQELAPAKINLDLHVTGRRADGYHELDSLTAFAAFGDRLALHEHDRLELVLSGPFTGALAAEPDNLVLRAARRLAACAGRAAAVRIMLEKRLPVAAGLGGGSADAAAALRGLNRLWRLGMTPAELAEIATGLGADVPVCLAGRTARMRGVGERVEPWDGMPPLPVLLVNPNLPLATAAVFGALEAIGESAGRPWPPPREADAFVEWLRAGANHLEPPAMRLLPQICDVLTGLAAQKSCTLARMSGSGATCFGLFATAASRDAAAAAIGRARPGWWLAASTIGEVAG
jgi:4-diphosphocytidyl-2-C-methyl-D-erythritol kinase